MTVDISSEAVERFTPHLHEDWRGMMGVTAGMRSAPNGKYVRAEVYEAQAERIKELEATAKAPHLQTYWRERVASARNDALREAVQHIRDHAEVARKKMREAYDLGSRDVATTWSAIISHLDNEADAIAAIRKDAAMDRLVAEGQRCDAMTPQEGRSLPDRVMVWHSSPTLSHLGTWATTRYPEDAVAYVPEAAEMQPTVLDGTSPRAVIGEIGNQIHNLACEFQGNEDLAERLEHFACGLWSVAQSASPEPMPAMTPQEAATFDYCPNCGQPHGNGVDRFCHRCLNDEISPQEAAKVLPDWEGFGRAMLEDWPVRDVDGAELFDLSLKYGLIAEVPGGYDPEHHIDAEGISPETGDPWYEYTFRAISEDSHD